MSQNPNLFLSVGKQIKDEYGRVIGKIASFALTPSGKFDTVFIEQGDGRFMKHSVESLKLDGADITLISNIRSQANILCDQIPLIWRKDQAIKDLAGKKKIPQELYDQLHTNFDDSLTQLKNEAQVVIEEIDVELAKCNEEIKELNYALVNLEIEHEIGKMDNQQYESAFSTIQENLKRVNTEKTDLELTKTKIQNILLGDQAKTAARETGKTRSDTPKTQTLISQAPELPEPPVVVYVKEIGKTGI